MRDSELRIVSFISGGGSTMEAIGKACKGSLKGLASVVGIIASKEGIQGIERAQALDIPVKVIPRTGFEKGQQGTESWGLALVEASQEFGADVLSQNGWIKQTPEEVIYRFQDSIFNQHPAPLDPDNVDSDGIPLDFGGKGMYGIAPHAAVLEFQELSGRRFLTEATIHHVVPEYDRGEVVFRLAIPVEDGDTPEILQKRVLPCEHQAQIDFWELYARSSGNVPVLHRDRPLILSGENILLEKAKRFAIEYAREQALHG